METKRFYYRHSSVYGWCVYDRERNHTPAYEACVDLLPLQEQPDGSKVAKSPVQLPKEYAAMSLCRSLNIAYKRTLAGPER